MRLKTLIRTFHSSHEWKCCLPTSVPLGKETKVGGQIFCLEFSRSYPMLFVINLNEGNFEFLSF